MLYINRYINWYNMLYIRPTSTCCILIGLSPIVKKAISMAALDHTHCI